MKVFGVTGWKNTGKTGLMERLVSAFTDMGFRVATLKHAHHRFDVDHPGKDSYRHRDAGAAQVLLSSTNRWALMGELRGAAEPDLATHLARLDPADIVLIEGWKGENHPKIECQRRAANQPLIAAGDASICAIASDFPVDTALPQMNLDDTQTIAAFILDRLGMVDPQTRQKRAPQDCYSLPPGVDWTPVDVALAQLRDQIEPAVTASECAVMDGAGRILADDVMARQAHPPHANSAVDGYGFAGAIGPEGRSFDLIPGRAAAGAAFDGIVRPGQALRILTGAAIPAGVETVALQEEATLGDGCVSFERPIKQGSNIRPAGEDVIAGATVLLKGQKLRPQDLGLAAAAGIGRLPVYERLRVGVLSTGDELREAGSTTPGTPDANRPILLSVLAGWGFDAIDLGIAPDDAAGLRAQLDRGAAMTDAILTSGGASAGDEDHISKLLNDEGQVEFWRIAVKPGRPLAMGRWAGVPVFGLPGNPVAALVCTLIFARPALHALAGGGFPDAPGYMLPAGFAKFKKPGRREYLRGRVNDQGRLECFASEGSGRISGLSWADGLIELPDHGMQIEPGTLLRFLPFSGLLA